MTSRVRTYLIASQLRHIMQEDASSRRFGVSFASSTTRWRCAERRIDLKLTILVCMVLVAKATAELTAGPGPAPGPERSVALRMTESTLSCSEVRLILSEKVKNVGDVTGTTDNHRDASSSVQPQQPDVCSVDSICCTREMETWLLMQGGREMKKMLGEKMKTIKQTFVTWTAKFDGFFRGLLERSKRSLYDLLNRNYGPLFEDNSQIFIQLYSDLRSHYRSDELNLEDVLDRFFTALLQRIFSTLNTELEPTEEYLQCVAEQMDLLRPFGEVPQRMHSEIRRSFLAARAFVQGLSLGKDIIITMAKQPPDDECARTMARMLFCQFCDGHASVRACVGPCVQSVGRCLSQQIELQDDWTNYLRELLRVAERLSDPFNFESVMRHLDVTISEAVMTYQKNVINVTTLVIHNCGNPPTKTRRRRELNSDNATSRFIPSSSNPHSSSSASSRSSSFFPSSSSSPPSTAFSSSHLSSFLSSSISSSLSSYSTFHSSSSSSPPSSSDSSSSPTTRAKSGQRQQQRKQQRQRQQHEEQQRQGQPEQRVEQQTTLQYGQPEQREEQHEETTQRQPEEEEHEEQLRQEHGQPDQQEEQRRQRQQHEEPTRRQPQQRQEQPRQSNLQKEQRRQQRQRERIQEEQRRQQQEDLARQQQLYDEQQRQPLLRQPQESDQYIEQPPVEQQQQQQQQRQRGQQVQPADSQQNRKQREPGQPRQRQQQPKQQRGQQRPGPTAEALTELEVLLRDIRRKLEAVRTFWAGLPLAICGDVIGDHGNESTCWNGSDLSTREGVAAEGGYVREAVVLTSVTRQQLLKFKVAADKLRQAYSAWNENDFDSSGNGLDFGSGTEVDAPTPPVDEIQTDTPEVATTATDGATETPRRLNSASGRTNSVAALVPVLLSMFVYISL